MVLNAVAVKIIEPSGDTTTPSPSKRTTSDVVSNVTERAFTPSFCFVNSCFFVKV